MKLVRTKELILSWHPEDYASLRFKVEYEKNEWATIKKQYEESKLDSLLLG